MTDHEFEDCIRRMQNGEKEALKQIYQAYIGLIYSVVYHVVRQKEDAQDVTSEFFIRLWDKAGHYHFGGKHKAWIITIARNMAIDFMRKYKREILLEELPDCGEQEDFAAEIVDSISFQEAVEELNHSQQEVMDLKILGEFTFREIAHILKKPIGTVTWLYQDAIKRLRKTRQEKEVQE